MLALIEGDANRVEDGYLKALTSAQRKQYDREQAALGSAFDKETVDVPPFVELLFSAPYELGPPTIRMLIAEGGNTAVNTALTGPTPTSADFVQAGLIAPPPPNLPAPTLAPGEQAEGSGEAFGAFELYVTLAARDDAAGALTAADAILGGRRAGTAPEREVLLPGHARGARCRRGEVRSHGADPVGDQGDGCVGRLASDRASRSPLAIREPLPSALRGNASPPPRCCWRLALKSRSASPKAAGSPRSPGASLDSSRSVPARSPRCSSPVADHFRPTRREHVRELVQQEALTCRDNPKAGLL